MKKMLLLLLIFQISLADVLCFHNRTKVGLVVKTSAKGTTILLDLKRMKTPSINLPGLIGATGAKGDPGVAGLIGERGIPGINFEKCYLNEQYFNVEKYDEKSGKYSADQQIYCENEYVALNPGYEIEASIPASVSRLISQEVGSYEITVISEKEMKAKLVVNCCPRN